MSNEKEKSSEALGAINPSAELRKATAGLKLCKKAFKKLGFMDYLNAVNEHYLNNQGSVEKPEKSISAGPKPEVKMIDRDRLNLSQAYSSIFAKITWDAEDEKTPQKSIEITLTYHHHDNAYTLNLYAWSSKAGDVNKDMQVGADIQRTFWLTPPVSPRLSEFVDDALLAFTSELLDSGIISN